MHSIPDEVKKKVEELVGSVEIDHVVESDLNPDGSMGGQWLVATKERMLIISPDHGTPIVAHDIPVKDLNDIKAEGMVGNGCIIANVRGKYIPLVRYSNAVAKEFGHSARRLQALAKGEEPPATTDEDKTRRCPKCGFPLEVGSNSCPNCVNRAKAMQRLLQYIKPYKVQAILTAALIILAQVLVLIPNYLTKILIDDIFGKAEPYKGHIPSHLSHHLSFMLAMLVVALIVSRVIGMLFGVIQSRITAYLGSHIVHDIRMQLYSTLERLTIGFFDKRQTGAVISRISQDTNALQEFLAFDVQWMASNLLILIFIIAIMLLQNWKLALLTLLPAPIASIVATIIFTRIRWMYGRVWHKWSKLHGVMSDSLQGLRVVKAFAQEDREVSRFEHRSYELCTANMQAEQTWNTLIPILSFVLTAGQFIVWYAGGVDVIYGKVTIGTLMMFIGYLGMLYGPLQILTRMWDWISRCLSASERIFEIIDAQLEEADPENQVRIPDMQGRVKFNNVTFGYDKNRPVLKEVSFEVEPGEMIGLCGHSGAGKSTMINLLARFYTAQEGSIEIDGVDIRNIHLEDLRSQIGMVPQEGYLFSGTIAENIAYAKSSATPEEIIRAAKAANAHDFITNLPDGYQTQVGERGHSLSGGERQRISIARAILHDPKVLILDEATSSVDTGTEKQIQEALQRLVKNRTTFAIAHRLSTLRDADRLIVLDKGKLAEIGTHEELMAKPNGIFAGLIKIQTEQSEVMAVGG